MNAVIPIGTNLDTGRPYEFPIDIATARLCELGKSGYGKTNGDAVLVEGLVRAGVPTVVADPLGQMRGYRSGRDGEAQGGIEIAIFGGEHGDFPLPFHKAQYLADMLGEGFSAVLDLSLIDPVAHEDFMRIFLPRLLQRATSLGVAMHVNFHNTSLLGR